MLTYEEHFPVEPLYKTGLNGLFILVGDTVFIDTHGRKHLIEDGFEFSPSIPRAFQPLVPVNPFTIIASLAHDFLYWLQITTRKFADDQWRSILSAVGASKFTIETSYPALRVVGWHKWNGNKRKLKQ